MNKLGLLKSALGFVASVGVGAVVKNAVTATTPDDAQKYMKIVTLVGGFVVGSMVSAQATKYAEKQVDDVAESVTKIKEAAAEAKQTIKDAKKANLKADEN